MHPVDKDPQRVTKYKSLEHEFDETLNGIEFPVKLFDVSKFAKRTNTSINVYCFDNGLVATLEVTKEEKEKHIDLLYLTEKDKNHYCWIKDFGRLVGSRVTKHKEKSCFCKMCLSIFHSEEKLNDRKTYCGAHKPVKIEMPKPGENILQFEQYSHSLNVPFAVYADFECMLQKFATCQPSNKGLIYQHNIYIIYTTSVRNILQSALPTTASMLMGISRRPWNTRERMWQQSSTKG